MAGDVLTINANETADGLPALNKEYTDPDTGQKEFILDVRDKLLYLKIDQLQAELENVNQKKKVLLDETSTVDIAPGDYIEFTIDGNEHENYTQIEFGFTSQESFQNKAIAVYKSSAGTLGSPRVIPDSEKDKWIARFDLMGEQVVIRLHNDNSDTRSVKRYVAVLK